MWGLIRNKLKNNQLHLIYDDKQITQLSNRKYRVNSDGEIELEKKEDMKKRGLTSPDKGDALGLSLYEPKIKPKEFITKLSFGSQVLQVSSLFSLLMFVLYKMSKISRCSLKWE